MSQWFGADRRKSWQRLSLCLGTILLSSGLLVEMYIGEDAWSRVVIAALGVFVGSETVRHYKRLGSERPADPENYGEEPV